MQSKTHWRKLTNPNYFGSWDFEPGEEKILTIDYVAQEVVDGADGKKENCPVLHFIEKVKPLVMNHTNGKMISRVLDSPIIEDWHGKRIALHVQKVKAFGEVVEAVRVKDKIIPQMKSAESTKCADCNQEIKDAAGFKSDVIIAGTTKRYGVPLCYNCGAIRKDKLDASALTAQKEESEQTNVGTEPNEPIKEDE